MWDTEMLMILRGAVGDLEYPQRYTDERLLQLLLIGANFVLTDLDIKADYIVDMDEMTINPDPSDRDAGTRDEVFMNLVVMKAACILEYNEARAAAGKAFTLKQGNNSISYGGAGGVADNTMKIWQQGWCKTYEQAKLDFNIGNYNAIGSAVIGPTKAYGYYGYPVDGRYR